MINVFNEMDNHVCAPLDNNCDDLWFNKNKSNDSDDKSEKTTNNCLNFIDEAPDAFVNRMEVTKTPDNGAIPPIVDTDNSEIQPNLNDNSCKEFRSKKTVANTSKYDLIEKCTKPYLVIKNDNKKVRISIKNQNGKNLLHDHFFAVKKSDCDHPIKQNIVAVSPIHISCSFDMCMASIQIENGTCIILCPIFDCNLAYTRTSDAKNHAIQHFDNKPYKCKYLNCTWSFYSIFKLKRHEETHLRKKNFNCMYPDCLRKFTTIYNLNEHRRKLHEKKADLPCSVESCSELFQNARERQIHFKSHSPDEAPYKCTVAPCKKKFFLESALQTHVRCHTHKESELNCQWPNCGRKFNQPSKLKAHLRIHTGQKPYHCLFDGCKWAFTTSSKLRRHEISHTNERKFHCTIGTCNKSFLRSEHLKDHTLTHIGQKSFVCEDCLEKFMTRPSLYLHIKKKHPEKSKSKKIVSDHRDRDTVKPSTDVLLEEAVQSLGVPSDMILGTGLIPDGQLELVGSENFSTVNLRDLE